MRRPSTETLHEKIEAQNVIIERLRADNKALLKSAEALLEKMEDLREETWRKNTLITEMAAALSLMDPENPTPEIEAAISWCAKLAGLLKRAKEETE